MLQRARRFAVRLHKDESGPNTVEWVLLIIIALILLLAIFAFAKWVIDQFSTAESNVEGSDFIKENKSKTGG